MSLQISYLNALGKLNWQKTERVIQLIEKARVEGLDVPNDRYPYLAYSTVLLVFFGDGHKKVKGKRLLRVSKILRRAAK